MEASAIFHWSHTVFLSSNSPTDSQNVPGHSLEHTGTGLDNMTKELAHARTKLLKEIVSQYHTEQSKTSNYAFKDRIILEMYMT